MVITLNGKVFIDQYQNGKSLHTILKDKSG